MKRPFLFILLHLIVCLLLIKFFNIYFVVIYIVLSVGLLLSLKNYGLIILLSIIGFYSVYLSVATITVDQIYANDFIGTIEEYNLSSEDKFILTVEKFKMNGKYHQKKFKVLITYDGDYSHLIGERVVLQNFIHVPRRNSNPKMFNYQKYLLSKDITYLSTADQQNIQVIENKRINLRKVIYDIRRKILNKIDQIYDDETSKFIKAFIIGFQEDENFEAFYFTGIGHILVVSGMHFAIVYLFIKKILELIKINKKTKDALMFMTLFVFLALIGFKISGIRTFLVILIRELANKINRRFDLLNVISAVALVFIINNPFIIYSLSFILSFGAVISIGLFYNAINKYLPKAISLILSVQIVITFINIYFFNYKNFISILLNIPISFIVGFLYIAIVINFIFYPVQFITLIVESIIRLIYYLVEFSKNIQLLTFENLIINHVLLITLLVFLLFYIYTFENKKFNQKITSHQMMIVILSFILLLQVDLYFNEELKIYFFDVGQGDCIFVQTPQKVNILIDGGPDQNFEKLSEILLKNNIQSIDYMILSHSDTDHLNGLIEVYQQLPVENLIHSKASTDVIHRFNKLNLIEVNKNDKIKVNEVTLSVLNPIEGYPYKDGNNSSIVIDLNYHDFNLLLTGDIDQNIENNIQLNKTHYDLLKVSHHGSKFSTGINFLKKVNPQAAVIQCGQNNYGHPHQEVLNRLKTQQIRYFRTDSTGALIVTVKNDIMRIEKTKDDGGFINVL